jgi:hypothetical protein
LERLLTRADECITAVDWRADAYRSIAPHAQSMPGVGAAALCAAHGVVEGAWVFLATPVHYVAELSNVRLAADGILALRQSEADALADDFNRVWHDAGTRLIAGRAAELFCVFDRAAPAATRDPEELLDRHIESYLPQGADAPRLRRLMSEIEMWLFDHQVNRARMTHAQLPVNGLWLWGGGPTLRAMPRAEGWAAGTDPFFKLFARAAAGTDDVGADDAGADDAGADDTNAAVIVVAEAPGAPGWGQVESRWIRPALEQLRLRRLARLDLSAGDRCYRVSSRWSRRFWRRRRPWWESFE